MSKNCTKVRAARAARLFFLIQPIRSLFSGVFVVVAVVFAYASYYFCVDGWCPYTCRYLKKRCQKKSKNPVSQDRQIVWVVSRATGDLCYMVSALLT